MRLLLIRHAQTPLNAARVLDTVIPGPELSELGRQQAAALVETLAGEDIQAIYASVLTRTQRTAGPLARARELAVTVREGLHEIPAGEFEGRDGQDAYLGYQSTLLSWVSDLQERMPGPGGESGREFFARYDAAIESICQDGHQCVAVVSHGAAIRVWVCGRVLNLPRDFSSDNYLLNTSIAVLDGDMRSGWRLLSWAGEPIP